MANNIFQTINMKTGDDRKSYQWYRDQVRNLGSGLTGTQLLRNEKLSSRIVPGNMYLFMYDPKHKETLPYYDTVPLVLPFKSVPEGFLGINLHYLPSSIESFINRRISIESFINIFYYYKYLS